MKLMWHAEVLAPGCFDDASSIDRVMVWIWHCVLRGNSSCPAVEPCIFESGGTNLCRSVGPRRVYKVRRRGVAQSSKWAVRREKLAAPSRAAASRVMLSSCPANEAVCTEMTATINSVRRASIISDRNMPSDYSRRAYLRHSSSALVNRGPIWYLPALRQT
jgi:hypothetical protein